MHYCECYSLETLLVVYENKVYIDQIILIKLEIPNKIQTGKLIFTHVSWWLSSLREGSSDQSRFQYQFASVFSLSS